MSKSAKQRIIERKKRAFRVRKKISGTASIPRVCVRRTLKHISAQVVDDVSGNSIAQLTSASKEVAAAAGADSKKTKIEISEIVGKLLAEKLKEKGIEKAVFDRKGYLYHGRIKALADAVRENGIII